MQIHPGRWPFYVAGAAAIFVGAVGVGFLIAGQLAPGSALILGALVGYEIAYRLVRHRV